MLALTFDRSPPNYVPFDLLTARIQWEHQEPGGRLLVQVLWYTTGKGTSAEHVWAEEFIETPDADGTRTWSAYLPRAPLCVEGRLVCVKWCVRLSSDETEDALETKFQLTYGDAAIVLSQFQPPKKSS